MLCLLFLDWNNCQLSFILIWLWYTLLFKYSSFILFPSYFAFIILLKRTTYHQKNEVSSSKKAGCTKINIFLLFFLFLCNDILLFLVVAVIEYIIWTKMSDGSYWGSPPCIALVFILTFELCRPSILLFGTWYY